MIFKKIISLIIFSAFTLWILPLGVFIRADQEKKFCDGQRAICLCKHLVDKQMAKNAGKILLRNMAAAPEKESGSSSSPQFLLPKVISMNRSDKALALSDETMFYTFLFTSAVEHVPKRLLI